VPTVTDLIHRRTRNAFRETCSDASVVRQIEQAFENEGFDPADDQDAGAGGPVLRSGQKVTGVQLKGPRAQAAARPYQAHGTRA